MTDYEYFPTPEPFTAWLFDAVPIVGRCAELGVGDGAIVRASAAAFGANRREWVTNDIDRRWMADYNLDATQPELYDRIGPVDWHVGNPAFTPALAIIERQIAHAHVGVAMHLRASIHEVLKTGPRRTWMTRYPPTGILWQPRFAYQRSKKTGKWTTDSVGACWVVWLKRPQAQFIRYAPERVLDALDAFTPAYRARMDSMDPTRCNERTAP